ncbi:MAG: arginyltransferase [Campylobacterota bacterium]|nr:arginyltransferase [Campylobacterota bacterium]
MNRILKECAIDDSCSYLEDQQQTTHYKIIDDCSSSQCSALIERGWRRFGTMFFRPICEDCTKCESIKIDVDNYVFSKSDRRVIKKSSHFNIIIQPPTLTTQHLDLFKRYHDYMQEKRGWDHQNVTAQNYFMSFVQGHGSFGYEVLYFDEERLIAVDLIDVLEEGISSIYFYYDPDYQSYSLGKYSIYYQIEYAKQLGLPWIYLGYYVQECQSLSYKSRYKPYMTLQGRPSEEETYHWSLTD